MFQPRTSSIIFSPEHPEAVVETLLPILHQSRALPDYKKLQPILHQSPTVLLIDEMEERCRYLVHMLQAKGYDVQVVSSAVDAFKLFLAGSFVPFVVLLGQEQTSDRFFLMRFLQQVLQKYGWNPPCIYIRARSTSTSRPLPTAAQQHADAVSPFVSMQEAAMFSPAQVVPSLVPEPQPSSSSVSASPLHVSSMARQEYAPLPVITVNTPMELSIADIPTLHKMPIAGPLTPLPLSAQESPAISIEAGVAGGEHISLVGLSIGRYHIQTSLGSGPLGDVYRTYDRLREYDVALKSVQMDTIPRYIDTHDFTSDNNLFQQEIDLLHSLQHPHILAPLSCGKSYISGSPFVYKTMRYCAAGSLARWLHARGNARMLSPLEVANVVGQLADALQLLHQKHVTYQNFKLSNLLIREPVDDAKHLHILLTDFALARDGTFLLKTPSIYPYMAPERWQGQSLSASDQYGLAAIAYELLTGRPLFSGQSEYVVRQLHLTMQPPAPSTLSPNISTALDKVLLRALAKRADDRFPSIVAFAEALHRASV